MKWDGFFMVNLNGNLFGSAEARVNLGNRGLHYGDAFFETMRLVGNEIIFWDDHSLRLFSTLDLLRMEVPHYFSKEFVREEVRRTVAAAALNPPAWRVKLLLWRKEGGKYSPTDYGLEYAIFVEPLNSRLYLLQKKKLEMGLFKDHHLNGGMLSSLKTTNRILNVLAGIFAAERGFDNCFLLNQERKVVEALNGNIFLVEGQSIKTPPLKDGALNGIIRKQLLAIVHQLPDFTCTEESVMPSDLLRADEILITNSIQGLTPVTNYSDKVYGDGLAQLLTAELNRKAGISN